MTNEMSSFEKEKTFMKYISFGLVALVAAGIIALGGCETGTPAGPEPGLGSATVTKYVSVGNSITAGYQSNSLYESAQKYSFPNLIAQQLTLAGANIGKFEQPIVSDPGLGTTYAQRYEILSLSGPGGKPVIGPRIPSTPGTFSNTALARPYDNLGIPGIPLASFLDTTGNLGGQLSTSTAMIIGAILRPPPVGPFPKSIFAHVAALNPDLVTFWLGNNDVLGFATSGGVSPSAPTNSTVFGFLYNQAIDTLRKVLPNAKIIVATIPDVSALPFFTTVGPSVAPVLASLNVYLRYQKHGNTGVAFDSTMLNTADSPLIPLTASTYAGYIGQATGKWYTDKGYPGLPAGIDTTKPFGLHPQNPWPDALALDADEITTAKTAITAFNTVIKSTATTYNCALVDVYTIFNDIKANGYLYGGVVYKTDYITGGIFSLDGVHPSDIGHGIIANEFVKVMNAKYGMKVPMVNLSTLPGIPVPLPKAGFAEKIVPVIPYEAFSSFGDLWGW